MRTSQGVNLREISSTETYTIFLISEIELKNVGFVTRAFGGGKKSSAPCGLVALWPCGLVACAKQHPYSICCLVALWLCGLVTCAMPAQPVWQPCLPALRAGWLGVARARRFWLAGRPAGSLLVISNGVIACSRKYSSCCFVYVFIYYAAMRMGCVGM